MENHVGLCREIQGIRVLFVDVVLHGVLATIVLNRGQILRGEGARSRDLHCVQERETTRVARRVRDEVVVLFVHGDGSVGGREGVEACRLDLTILVDRVKVVIDAALLALIERQAIVAPVETVLVNVGVIIKRVSFLLKCLLLCLEAV